MSITLDIKSWQLVSNDAGTPLAAYFRSTWIQWPDGRSFGADKKYPSGRESQPLSSDLIESRSKLG
jgi:hypothetical protein